MAARPPRARMRATVAASRRVRQSQRMLPPPEGRRRRAARWPMANLGVVCFVLAGRGGSGLVWSVFACGLHHGEEWRGLG